MYCLQFHPISWTSSYLAWKRFDGIPSYFFLPSPFCIAYCNFICSFPFLATYFCALLLPFIVLSRSFPSFIFQHLQSLIPSSPFPIPSFDVWNLTCHFNCVMSQPIIWCSLLKWVVGNSYFIKYRWTILLILILPLYPLVSLGFGQVSMWYLVQCEDHLAVVLLH